MSKGMKTTIEVLFAAMTAAAVFYFVEVSRSLKLAEQEAKRIAEDPIDENKVGEIDDRVDDLIFESREVVNNLVIDRDKDTGAIWVMADDGDVFSISSTSPTETLLNAVLSSSITTNWTTVSKTTPVFEHPEFTVLAVHIVSTLNQRGDIYSNTVAKVEYEGKWHEFVLKSTLIGETHRKIPEGYVE